MNHETTEGRERKEFSESFGKDENFRENEETIKEHVIQHDQKLAINRNIIERRLLLKGWLAIDRQH
jgi:hypothetical protein